MWTNKATQGSGTAVAVVREPTYKVPQVAEYLEVSDGAVYKLVKEGQLRAVRVGRLLRITETALAEFMAGR